MVESVNSVSDNSKFAVSLVTPWIKGSMNVDDNFMKIDMPNTVFFGLIPAGKSKDTSPLSGVTNVYTSNSYKIVPLHWVFCLHLPVYQCLALHSLGD